MLCCLGVQFQTEVLCVSHRQLHRLPETFSAVIAISDAFRDMTTAYAVWLQKTNNLGQSMNLLLQMLREEDLVAFTGETQRPGKDIVAATDEIVYQNMLD